MIKTEDEINAGARVLMEACHKAGLHATLAFIEGNGKITVYFAGNTLTGTQLGSEIIYQVRKHIDGLENKNDQT